MKKKCKYKYKWNEKTYRRLEVERAPLLHYCRQYCYWLSFVMDRRVPFLLLISILFYFYWTFTTKTLNGVFQKQNFLIDKLVVVLFELFRMFFYFINFNHFSSLYDLFFFFFFFIAPISFLCSIRSLSNSKSLTVKILFNLNKISFVPLHARCHWVFFFKTIRNQSSRVTLQFHTEIRKHTKRNESSLLLLLLLLSCRQG